MSEESLENGPKAISGPEAALHEVRSVALRFFLSIAGTKLVASWKRAVNSGSG
jgi:hypothetical protein